MEGFIQIPNNMIWGDTNDNLIQKIDDKVLLIWIYLKNHECKGRCYFSLEDMIQECGYKPDSHKGKINDKFKEILDKMLEKKIILKTSVNPNSIKSNIFVKCELKIIESNFFLLEDKQYNTIQSHIGKLDKLNLLKVFCLIKSKMYQRNFNESIISGKYEVSFPSYKEMADNCLISESSIKQYIDELVQMNLIRYKNLGMKVNKNNGETTLIRNTYTIYKEGWEDEIDGAINQLKKQLKNNEYIIKNEKMINKNKLGGEKTQILKRIKENKTTKKDIKRLQEINEILQKEKPNNKRKEKEKPNTRSYE